MINSCYHVDLCMMELKDLKEERSKSLSSSINYDKATDHYIYGFTLEGFYTQLVDAFYQDPNGEDLHGALKFCGLVSFFSLSFKVWVQTGCFYV